MHKNFISILGTDIKKKYQNIPCMLDVMKLRIILGVQSSFSQSFLSKINWVDYRKFQMNHLYFPTK